MNISLKSSLGKCAKSQPAKGKCLPNACTMLQPTLRYSGPCQSDPQPNSRNWANLSPDSISSQQQTMPLLHVYISLSLMDSRGQLYVGVGVELGHAGCDVQVYACKFPVQDTVVGWDWGQYVSINETPGILISKFKSQPSRLL